MTNIRRALVTLGLGAALAAGNAFGGTITQTFTVSTTGTEIANSQSNSPFFYYGHYAPAGQTLTGVTLQFTGSETLVNLSVANPLTTTQYYTEAITGNLLVNSVANQNSDGAAMLDDPAALSALQNSGAGFAGNIWTLGNVSCFMGIGASATQSWYTNGSVSGSAPSLTNAGNTSNTGAGSTCTPNESGSNMLAANSGIISGILADYLGTGQFNLSFTTSTSSGGVNANVQSGVTSSTVAGGTFTVIYTYGPSGTPEPTTMLLFGSSLVGLGLLRRRAVKR